MNDNEASKLKAELAALKARLAKLTKEKSKTELLPGFSWILGTEQSGKAYRMNEINTFVRKLAELVRDTGVPQTASEWHVASVGVYSAQGAMIGIQCEEPVMSRVRTMSVEESRSYFEGEQGMILRKVIGHDPKGYRYKRTNIRMTKDNQVKSFMRIRG
jgi:hypothetical protein